MKKYFSISHLGLLSLAALVLAGCASLGGRFPASKVQPPSGLGTFACVKAGFSNAGFSNVSNRSLAMIAVVAKLHSFHDPMMNSHDRDVPAMTSTLQTALAYGLREQKTWPFATEMDAIQAEAWISMSSRPTVDDALYYKIFAIPKNIVISYDTPGAPWTSLPAKRKSDLWNQLASGYEPYAEVKPFADSDKKKICSAVISSCGLAITSCDEPPATNADHGYAPDNKADQGADGPPGTHP